MTPSPDALEVHEISDISSPHISEDISYYGAQAFALQGTRASLPLVTCSSPHRTSKEGDIMHLP